MGFVIHGGIDGFSRSIVYLKCATNNNGNCFGLFEEVISKFGVPARVKSDKGSENVMGKDLMTKIRGGGRGSYIAGSSVHNRRKEKLWRDVWNTVCCNFITYSRPWRIKVIN